MSVGLTVTSATLKPKFIQYRRRLRSSGRKTHASMNCFETPTHSVSSLIINVIPSEYSDSPKQERKFPRDALKV